MFTIYHNPHCKKSRAGLSWLAEKGMDYSIVEYLKSPLTEAQLKQLLIKLNLKAFELIRTQEEVYKTQFKNKNFNEDEWVKIMIENPKLIKRPIVTTKHKAVIGDPIENLECLIKIK